MGDPATAALAAAAVIDAIGETVEHGSQIVQAGQAAYHHAKKTLEHHWGTPKRKKSSRMPGQDMDVVKTEANKNKHLVQSGVFTPKVFSTVVGNPDLVQQNYKCHFGSVSGWRYHPFVYKRAAIQSSPLVLKIGNCLTTTATDTIKPTWVIDHGGTFTDNHHSWFSSNHVLCGKAAASAYSTLEVVGKSTNEYADFCIPIFPNHQYGQRNIGSDLTQKGNEPFGTLDLFSEFRTGNTTTGGINDMTAAEVGDLPYTYGFINDVASYMAGITGGTPSTMNRLNEAFVNVTTEIRLTNNADASQIYEVYHLKPRKICKSSPLHDLDNAEDNNYEEDYDGYDKLPHAYHRLGTNLMQWKVMRRKWRCGRKRTFVVAPGHSVDLTFRVPMSLVQYGQLTDYLESGTVTFVPGLSSFCYIRACGQTLVNGVSYSVGSASGSFMVEMYQKIWCLNSRPHVVKRIDLSMVERVSNGTTNQKFRELTGTGDNEDDGDGIA